MPRRERWAEAELQRLQDGDPKNVSVTESHCVSCVSQERASVSPRVQPGGPSVYFVSLERASVSPRVQPGGPSVCFVLLERARVSPRVQPGGLSVCFVLLERASVSPHVQPGGPSVFCVAREGECVTSCTAGRTVCILCRDERRVCRLAYCWEGMYVCVAVRVSRGEVEAPCVPHAENWEAGCKKAAESCLKKEDHEKRRTIEEREKRLHLLQQTRFAGGGV